MEAALVSAVTGVLKPVLGKLGALLGDKYKRFKGVHKEIKSLIDELAAMDAFLMKMSMEEDPDVQDKVWMNEVRELSYGMEDCIDNFMQSFDDSDAKPEGFIENIKHLLGKLGKMKARRRIGNEIHDLKKQITDVGERNMRYKTRESFSKNIHAAGTKNRTIDPRVLIMYEHALEIVGIDEPKAELIKMLTQEDGCASVQHHLKLVSIVGSGGMGKTTLANVVYQEVKEQFKCRSFLSVSRNPDVMNILRTILSEVSGQGYATTEAGSIQQLINNIHHFLADKRYFIVIDDIWDVDTWDVIKRAFLVNNYSSRVITTTRIRDVAKACHSSFNGNIYCIQSLNMTHSRQLFHRRLFDSSEDFPPHLQDVSEQILHKCDGLPLAIITIAGLLSNREKTEDLWKQVSDSIGHALERNRGVKRMMQILSLSYIDLPPQLRSCLLYISIFPEDSYLKRKCLIRGWIGEGLIHKEGQYTAHEIGERCFNELVNRSLIQPLFLNELGKAKACQVHDTILDFIISKCIEENFATLVGVPILPNKTQKKVVRRLSLQVNKQGHSTIPTSGLLLSHVRSLYVFGMIEQIPCLEEFRHMRVLNLEYSYLPEKQHLGNIMSLFQLRYLNLQHTRISELPEQIGRLGCLEMLDLRITDVEQLPASIVNLRKLTHLLVDLRVKFPEGIAKMQALETLKHVRASRQPLGFISGLGELKNLRNLFLICEEDYELRSPEVVQECNEAIFSSMCKLVTQNLRRLSIVNGSSLLQRSWWSTPLTLEKLITRNSSIMHVPEWVSFLRNLQWLRLEVEALNQDDICILGALPALLLLHLHGVHNSSGKLRISGAVGFRFLRIFNYDAHFLPVDLLFAPGSMPKLEKLKLYCFHVVGDESVEFAIENLPCLLKVSCTLHGDYGLRGAVKTVLQRAANTHPNHPALFFSYLEILNPGGNLPPRTDNATSG